MLADRLAGALGQPAALTVVKGDALDLAKDGSLDGFGKMVSNLPYQAGTRILLELIKRLEKEMREAARILDFERAAELRDMIMEMKAED